MFWKNNSGTSVEDGLEGTLAGGRERVQKIFAGIHIKDIEFPTCFYILVYVRHSINIFNQINKLQHEAPLQQRRALHLHYHFKVLKGEKGYSLIKKSESIFCGFLFLVYNA